MLTGLTTSTFQSLELDSGVFLKNFDLSSITTKSALASAIESAKDGESWVGATKGGGTFEAKPTTRNVELDGMRSAFVGSTMIDGWEIKLSTELAEFTADNMVLALGAASATTSGNVTTIAINNAYKDTDYIEKFCWIGSLANGTMCVIELDNVLATGGMTLKFEDKNNATIPIELYAHQDDVTATDTAPARIKYFE